MAVSAQRIADAWCSDDAGDSDGETGANADGADAVAAFSTLAGPPGEDCAAGARRSEGARW